MRLPTRPNPVSAERTIGDMIRRNLELADALGICGTPAFVTGAAPVPGAVDVDVDTLKALIARARQRVRQVKSSNNQ